MDFFMVVIVVVSFMSIGSGIPTKVHKRLNLLKTRVDMLETQICLESDKNKTAETADTEIISPAPLPDAIGRVLTVFNEEKVKLRSTADTIENILDEIQHNMTKETDQTIQAMINDYTELKFQVQNINETLIELQDEIQQYITSDKGNASLLSAELKELVSQLGFIGKSQIRMGESYNEMKQDFNHLSKICPNLWSRYGKFCYRLFKNNVNFPGARKICAAADAYVVDVQNVNEQKFIWNMTQSVWHHWIGLTYSKTEDSWKWDRTNSTATFTYWRAGKAYRFYSPTCGVVMNVHAWGKWIDWPCTGNTYISVVCKKAL